MSKYTVNIKGTNLDVYDIIASYKITNPAIQHAIKKLLKPGTRGHKDLKPKTYEQKTTPKIA